MTLRTCYVQDSMDCPKERMDVIVTSINVWPECQSNASIAFNLFCFNRYGKRECLKKKRFTGTMHDCLLENLVSGISDTICILALLSGFHFPCGMMGNIP